MCSTCEQRGGTPARIDYRAFHAFMGRTSNSEGLMRLKIRPTPSSEPDALPGDALCSDGELRQKGLLEALPAPSSSRSDVH